MIYQAKSDLQGLGFSVMLECGWRLDGKWLGEIMTNQNLSDFSVLWDSKTDTIGILIWSRSSMLGFKRCITIAPILILQKGI